MLKCLLGGKLVLVENRGVCSRGCEGWETELPGSADLPCSGGIWKCITKVLAVTFQSEQFWYCLAFVNILVNNKVKPRP